MKFENHNSNLSQFSMIRTHTYARARSSATTRASGPNKCPLILSLRKSGLPTGNIDIRPVVPYEISSMARPFDDKRTLARRGRKPKCVHPVHQRGMNSTNWWVWSRRRSIDKLRAQSQWPFLLHWPYSFVARFANKLEFFSSRDFYENYGIYVEIYISCFTLCFAL